MTLLEIVRCAFWAGVCILAFEWSIWGGLSAVTLMLVLSIPFKR